jgi:hypothetical protein
MRPLHTLGSSGKNVIKPCFLVAVLVALADCFYCIVLHFGAPSDNLKRESEALLDAGCASLCISLHACTEVERNH